MEKAATHFSIVHAKTCPTVLSRCFNLTCCNMAGHLPLAIWTLVCIQLLHWAITFLLLWHFGFCCDILGYSSASAPASAPLQHEMECLPVLHLFCNTQLLNNSLDIANKVLHDTNQIHCRRTTYPSQESSVLSFFRLFLRHRIPEEFKGCNTKSLNPSAMQVNTMTPTSKNKSPLVSPMYKGLEGYHVMGLRKPNKLP